MENFTPWILLEVGGVLKKNCSLSRPILKNPLVVVPSLTDLLFTEVTN
jgi:hypothetical protein